MIHNNPALLTAPVGFVGRDGREYSIRHMDSEYARRRSRALKSLHNLIPHVGDDVRFLDDEDDSSEAEFFRWSLSLAVEYEGKTIAFLSSYVRDYSERHPFRSAYLHRMAVAASHQRNLVGAHLVAAAVSLYFEAMPWLLTITVQTNDELANASVLGFYHRCGFRDRYKVQYCDKVDILMDWERTNATGPGSQFSGFIPLTAPARPPVLQRLPDPFNTPHLLEARSIYFGTTSNEKYLQYRSIFRSYGLRLQRLQHNISLTEPQIDAIGPTAESALVAAPLKLFSRFAAKNTAYPVMVEDTMLFIEHFNNEYKLNPILPGPDTKRWWMALGAAGIVEIVGGSARRAAKYVCQIGLNYGPGEYQYFRHEQSGHISDTIRIDPAAEVNFPFTNATFFHSIFVPEGSVHTIAEMDANEFLNYDYRRACVAKALPLLRTKGALDSQLGLFSIP